LVDEILDEPRDRVGILQRHHVIRSSNSRDGRVRQEFRGKRSDLL
jgi:hypothetical protein